jgi:hypothetical protein
LKASRKIALFRVQFDSGKQVPAAARLRQRDRRRDHLRLRARHRGRRLQPQLSGDPGRRGLFRPERSRPRRQLVRHARQICRRRLNGAPISISCLPICSICPPAVAAPQRSSRRRPNSGSRPPGLVRTKLLCRSVAPHFSIRCTVFRHCRHAARLRIDTASAADILVNVDLPDDRAGLALDVQPKPQHQPFLLRLVPVIKFGPSVPQPDPLPFSRQQSRLP